jgi:dTDP-L-rhamnose 4-epimerase
MDRAGVRRLVQASSMVVYGPGLGRCAEHGVTSPAPRRTGDLRAGRFDPPCPRCDRPLQPALVDEDAPLQPRNAYAVSKLAQEQLSAVWAHDTGGRVVNLRYHNVYGQGMPRDTPYAGVAALFLSALRRGEPPQVFEDGSQQRDFVHVRDVATATVDAVAAELDGVHALNIGSGVPRSVGEFASALARATGGPDPEVTGQFRSGDVRHITADSARARALLHWRPAVEFADGVAELVRD